MDTVAITGVGGLIGRRLVEELEARDAADRILGLDVTAPQGLSSERLEFRQIDIRDDALVEALTGADALVHLAFVLDPHRDEAWMRSINVDGSRDVFRAAVEAGVDHVTYLSSGVAYGAHPDNDFPLSEDSPLRANPRFNYAEHKREVELWLWEWLEETEPDASVTVLRPSIVAGPGVDNFISRQLEAPRFLQVKGYRPPWQFVHVDDVASAIVHSLQKRLEGPYNVTSEGWLSFDEVLGISGLRSLEVPEEVAFTAAERLWELGLAEAPPGQVHYVMYPWVMSVEKLVATGWRPKHSNRDAFAELVEDHRDHVTLLGLRMRRSILRRAAAAGAGAAALLLGRGLWRRLRDRDR